MTDLGQIKEKWEKERPKYIQLGEYVYNILRDEIKKIGVYANVTHRTKDLDKLLKKALRRQYSNPYDEITDKLGIRAILCFRKHLPLVDQIIQSTFHVCRREDKSEELGVDRWGYQGIHFDVELPEQHYIQNEEFKDLVFEIQLQTYCQNVWCELNHKLYYKSDLEMPNEYVRSINRLSALLETADIEFERAHTMISELPTYKEAKLLEILEKYFYELVARPFDRELSLDVLTNLCTSFEDLSAENYQTKLDSFLQSNTSMLEQVLGEYIATPERSLFLFQPEGLLMLLLMDEDPFRLKSAWTQVYPSNELENLASICGRTIS